MVAVEELCIYRFGLDAFAWDRIQLRASDLILAVGQETADLWYTKGSPSGGVKNRFFFVLQECENGVICERNDSSFVLTFGTSCITRPSFYHDLVCLFQEPLEPKWDIEQESSENRLYTMFPTVQTDVLDEIYNAMK